MWVLMVMDAWGNIEIPHAPAPTERKPGECQSAIPVGVGKRVPIGDDQCNAECSGVLLPTSMASDLIKSEKWAWRVHQICLEELDSMQDVVDESEGRMQRNSYLLSARWFGIGVATGAITVAILEIVSD